MNSQITEKKIAAVVAVVSQDTPRGGPKPLVHYPSVFLFYLVSFYLVFSQIMQLLTYLLKKAKRAIGRSSLTV